MELFNSILESTFVQGLAANAVVLGIISWLAKLWANKRIEDIKGKQAQLLQNLKSEQNKSIEELKGEISNLSKKYQSDLDRNSMIFKTHFDIEFTSYKELWAECDSAYDIANQCLSYYQRQYKDEDLESGKQTAISNYDICRLTLNKIRESRPFIDQEICDLSILLAKGCVGISHEYMDLYPHWKNNVNQNVVIKNLKEELEDLEAQYSDLARFISKRISSMYVAAP